MKTQNLHRVAWMLFIILSSLTPVWAIGDSPSDKVEGTDAAASQTASSTVQPSTPSSPFKLGIDFYAGASNLQGSRRFTDGFWAGYGSLYPSVISLGWDNGKGSAAKMSLCVGRLYSDSEGALHQPVEAWVQIPAGKATVTVGKFYVPFALQEWQYETKPGVMLQWAEGAYSLAASANYNRNTKNSNLYFRAERSLGKNVALGLSLGVGKGLSYDSEHDRALGLDGTFSWRGWQLSSEYIALQSQSGRCHFGYGQLSYEKLGRLKPYVARYSWNDKSETFGQFRSTVLGMSYQLAPYVALEGGYATTSEKGVTFLQIHWTWEK